MESRQVPTIGIAQALSLAPAGLPIEKLKLDAQGLDFKMLRAASAAGLLSRVRQLELEVVRDSCPSLYADQETHLVVNAHLQSAGFSLVGWRWHGHLKCEGTGFFKRTDSAAADQQPPAVAR